MRKLIALLALFVPCLTVQYEPNWDSLDARPIPQWYDDAKFGIFLHWGVFSVPSFGSEWFWNRWRSGSQDFVDYMERNYPPTFTYQEFAKDLKVEFWDPAEWAELFAASGAKYVVLTSKHHEGYAMWPSKYSYSWNSQDIGPKRDLVGELAQAVRAANITFGLYHSLLEWYHPLFVADKESDFVTQDFVRNKIIPELHELVETYKPAVVWSDGDGGGSDFYWNATNFLAWLYNESPVKDIVVTNDRWGYELDCQHGGFFTCSDRYNPGTLQLHKWENAMTLDKNSWGFRREAKLSDYLTTWEVLSEMVSTVSCGGNLLLNVGPTKEGIISPIYEERLRQIGSWLAINGEAIYSSQPWTAQRDYKDANIWYTSKNSTVYAISLHWPEDDNTLALGSAVDLFTTSGISVTLLGNEDSGPLMWTADLEAVRINFPDKAKAKSEWAYVLKIQSS